MHRNVAVIGGGLAALSGAIRLARMGFHVRLFEKNPMLGGKMNEHIAGPYRFDTGPSLLTMPFVADDLFAFAGSERSSRLEFVPIDPLCRYFFSDGSTFDASGDRDKMRAAIATFSPSNIEAFDRFIQYGSRIYDLTADIFLFTPFHEIRKMLRGRHLRTLFGLHRIDPFRTVHAAVSRFFSDPRLIQLFDRYATYTGSSPFRAPATLNIIPYVEYSFGGYYIREGMYRLVEAMRDIAAEAGVEIYTATRVERILQNQGRIAGIRVNDENIGADYVLCGTDVIVAHNELIDGFPRRQRRLNRLEPSLSGLVFLWGIRKAHPQLAMHNIFFSTDYQKEFTHLFNTLRPPDDPTIYIVITSRADSAHAPLGGENWFVLLNMPYLAPGQDWERETERMREIVLRKLQKAGVDVAGSIEVEKVYTPQDFEHLYASNRGSIYGLSSNSRSSAFRRPPNRSRDIRGLYFAGGSTHPGGGIPLVILSGGMAADLIGEAEGVRH